MIRDGRLIPPTRSQLAVTPTHEFLSSTGEWFTCHVVTPRLILITDPGYPLSGISKYCRLGRSGVNTDRMRKI